MDTLRPYNSSVPPSPSSCKSALGRLWVGIAACVFLQASVSLYAQAKPSEYDVKAAYLFNFGKFIRLAPNAPPSKHETFDICVLGQEPLSRILEGITANERINDRAVRVVRVKDAAEARACDIAYIGKSEGERIESDLAVLAGSDALTVSDASTFLSHGGMIQFVMVDNHVRFTVDLEAVKRTHLVLSSELLRVAFSVSGKPLREALP